MSVECNRCALLHLLHSVSLLDKSADDLIIRITAPLSGCVGLKADADNATVISFMLKFDAAIDMELWCGEPVFSFVALHHTPFSEPQACRCHGLHQVRMPS